METIDIQKHSPPINIFGSPEFCSGDDKNTAFGLCKFLVASIDGCLLFDNEKLFFSEGKYIKCQKCKEAWKKSKVL